MSSKAYICERCGKPATICHHKTYLNESNVHDPEIALNPANLEALCIDCHNAEHGLKHDIAVFDATGNVSEVKESVSTKAYEDQRAQIDDVVARARALLCGLKESDALQGSTRGFLSTGNIKARLEDKTP